MARRGNGEGSIYRRADGRWAATVTEADGGRKTYYGKTRAAVGQRLTGALKGEQDGTPSVNERKLVGAYLTEWLESAQPSLRPRTFARYEQYVRIHAMPALGRLKLARLAPAHLAKLYAARLAAGSSPATVVHLHRVMHRALKQAVRWGACIRNVAELVTPPRVPHHEMRSLAPDQARAFLAAAAGDHLEALYVLAVTTGMRQGELLGLRWRDLDLEAGSVRVQTSLQRTPHGFELAEPKTARSRRQIMLGEAARAALRRRRLQQELDRRVAGDVWTNHEGLVFTNPLGENALGVLRTSFPALFAQAGVQPVRFHDLRHSAASLLLSQGVHPKVVSEMLGHSTIAITLDLYSHVTPTMQREAAAVMDQVLAAR